MCSAGDGRRYNTLPDWWLVDRSTLRVSRPHDQSALVPLLKGSRRQAAQHAACPTSLLAFDPVSSPLEHGIQPT